MVYTRGAKIDREDTLGPEQQVPDLGFDFFIFHSRDLFETDGRFAQIGIVSLVPLHLVHSVSKMAVTSSVVADRRAVSHRFMHHYIWLGQSRSIVTLHDTALEATDRLLLALQRVQHERVLVRIVIWGRHH